MTITLTKMKICGVCTLKTFSLYCSDSATTQENLLRASHRTVSEQTRAGLSAQQLAVDQNQDPVRLPALLSMILSQSHTHASKHTLEHFLNAVLVPNH